MVEAVLLFAFICVALSGIEANKWTVSLPTDRLCVWSGTSAILSCKYDYPYGYGIRRVMWFRHTAEGKREYVFHTDLSVVSPSFMGRTRYSGTYKTCTLQISSVRSTDGGEYYFRFETDRLGGQWTSTDAITLSVTVLQVQVHPARQGNLFASGETVYLGCEARGCAATGNQFILYRNTVKLGSVESVTIHNFDTGHSGTYKCHLASLPQVHSPGVVLAVGYAPRQTTVVISPQGAIMEGSSVTLTCSSNADPAVESYSWFKDQAGWSLPDSFKPQLQLWSTRPSDRGEYYCVARNSLGSQKSPPVLLNITHAPRNTAVLIDPPGDVMEGSSATLICSSSANPPVMKYTWFVIAATQSLERGSTQNLTFLNVRAHHGGQYYCRVWNKYGHETSAALTLAVLYAPRNTSVSAWPSSEIEAGSSVTLICNSSANPAVENYTWFRINDADSRETRSGPSYTIIGITHREGGQYYCEARNKLGAHSSPVLTVRVRGRLKVIALASAVAVSAALVTLTVAIMISKNMHIVETEPAKEEQKTSSEQGDALLQGKHQETFQLSTTRMTDIPTGTGSFGKAATRGSYEAKRRPE
ncbi:sialoadhesin-like isoform X2 [Scleropages formosus]|uniref:sialoadhesin-like isoform X2 n=1 Tax=Scleropages formosus TaxID=113540 RepID=UPI0010FA7B30|nr:sialoadhesin-like isoform X2 [Scleropages formosus]